MISSHSAPRGFELLALVVEAHEAGGGDGIDGSFGDAETARALGLLDQSWRVMNSALPPSRMSVPRPAMLVAMVTMPRRPAWATISASRS